MTPSPLPHCVYAFWSSRDQRCLYVGKASTNPGDRIKSHFDHRQPWAVSADWIRLHWLDPGVPIDVAEQALIHQLTPRGNKQFNRGHYDAVWAAQVARRQAVATGGMIGWRATLDLVGAWVRSACGWVVRTAVTVAVVDAVVVLAVLVAKISL